MRYTRALRFLCTPHLVSASYPVLSTRSHVFALRICESARVFLFLNHSAVELANSVRVYDSSEYNMSPSLTSYSVRARALRSHFHRQNKSLWGAPQAHVLCIGSLDSASSYYIRQHYSTTLTTVCCASHCDVVHHIYDAILFYPRASTMSTFISYDIWV